MELLVNDFVFVLDYWIVEILEVFNVFSINEVVATCYLFLLLKGLARNIKGIFALQLFKEELVGLDVFSLEESLGLVSKLEEHIRAVRIK